MIKNKKNIFAFLFLAWAIIFAHGVIPHHHHFDDIYIHCNHNNLNNAVEYSEVHDCDLDSNNFTCHFQVKVLTQVSIDQDFIITTTNRFITNPVMINENHVDFYLWMLSEQIPKIKFLRGPPKNIIS